MLGDSYWLLGQLHRAKSEHRKAKIVAQTSLATMPNRKEISNRIELEKLEIVSSLNIGLCKIALWEIVEAVEVFEKILTESDKEVLKKYFYETQFCLAFLHSHLGNLNQAREFAQEANCLIDGSIDYKEYNLSAFSRGYCFLFLGETYKNLRDVEKSFKLLREAVLFAEEIYYPQVKAKALTGIAELYRIQSDFEKSLSNHSESIKLLEKISAKSDLAEAYFQLGLTYKVIGEMERSKECVSKAVQLYKEIEAPKQIKRVEKQIENEES